MKKTLKNKQGISLIVLVITIIIMIILAAAVILALNGNNVVEKANQAKLSSDAATIQEQAAVKLAEYELAKANGETSTAKEYIESVFNKSNGYTEDYYANEAGMIVATKHTEGTGDSAVTVPIPLGFTKSTVATEDSIDEGLVIRDNEGNEFVWVPVKDITKFQRTKQYNGIIVKPTDNLGELYEEPLVNGGYATEKSEYDEMKKSVETNGGFYIGRYEAGSEIKRTGIDDGTTKIIVKKGAHPYNYVAWGTAMNETEKEIENQGHGAVWLSKNMYVNSTSVVSTLCYGVQWDAALLFISQQGIKDGSYPTNSANKGWLGWTRGTWTTLNPNHMTGIDMTSSSNRLNNIYDMSGNLFEWSMEVPCNMHRFNRRVVRGGSYASASDVGSASLRYYYDRVYRIAETYGFRPTLYIK